MHEIPFVKVSAITHLSDARYFASHGVKIMGFCLDPSSPHYIDPYKVLEITHWVEGTYIAGEFDTLMPEAIQDLVESLSLNYAQLTPTSAAPCRSLLNLTPLILQLPAVTVNDLRYASSMLRSVWQTGDYVMINLKLASPTHFFTSLFADLLADLCRSYPVILDYHFTADNVLSFIHAFQPAGISIDSQPEIKTGIKLFEATDLLFEVLQKNF